MTRSMAKSDKLDIVWDGWKILNASDWCSAVKMFVYIVTVQSVIPTLFEYHHRVVAESVIITLLRQLTAS